MGEWATLTNSVTMFRAEHNVMTTESLRGAKNSTDAELKDSMLGIARNGDYANPTVVVSRTSLGRKVTMTGFKVIGGVSFRIEHQSYIGEQTILGLVVMATPNLFATKTVQNFFNSVALNSAYLPKETTYRYAPEGCEFEVTFPSKPTFRKVQMEAALEEEATLTTVDSMLRTEYATLSEKDFRAYQMASDSEIRAVFLSLGKESGYSSISVAVENSKLGREVVLRGYKTIQGVSVLYEHIMYFGKYSAITLVVMAPSKSFPTSDITAFQNSVKRR